MLFSPKFFLSFHSFFRLEVPKGRKPFDAWTNERLHWSFFPKLRSTLFTPCCHQTRWQSKTKLTRNTRIYWFSWMKSLLWMRFKIKSRLKRNRLQAPKNKRIMWQTIREIFSPTKEDFILLQKIKDFLLFLLLYFHLAWIPLNWSLMPTPQLAHTRLSARRGEEGKE